MHKLSTLCLVIPYFGKWPFWIPFFLQSCRNNHSIDWLIYTDCGALQNCPDNVTVHQISFQGYCELVSIRLNIYFQPQNPYKLCDVKPALGYIHAAALTHYDFWAFGDIDVVYGDLRHFFTESKLQQKDLFSTHARRVSGHFCLIRNNSEMNSAFMRVKHWQALLSSPKHMAFDEKAFSKLFLRHKNALWLRKLAMMLDAWLTRGEFVEAFTTPNAKIFWLDGSNHFPHTWFWKNGKVTNNQSVNKEFVYFHFMKWKQNWAHLNTVDLDLAHNPSIQSFSMHKGGINYRLINSDVTLALGESDLDNAMF